MTDTDRPLCDCPEPCACYAEGYAAGSGTETGSGTAFPEAGLSDSASCRPLKALGRRCHTRHFLERKWRSLTHHTRRVQPEARQAAQVHPAEPMRYLPVPHTVQTARRAGRPFFIVTCSTSREPVLARHFRQ